MKNRLLEEKLRVIAGTGLSEAMIERIAGREGVPEDVNVHVTGDSHAFAGQAVVGRSETRRFGVRGAVTVTEGVALLNQNIEFGREISRVYHDQGIRVFGGEKRTANFNTRKPCAVLITTREYEGADLGESGGGENESAANITRRALYIYIPPETPAPKSREPKAARPASRAGLTPSPPLVITEDGTVVSRLRVEKPDGYAIIVRANGVVIQECDISGAINIYGPVSGVTIRNNYIHDQNVPGDNFHRKQFAGITTTEGDRWGCRDPQPMGARDIKIIGNCFRNCQTGAYLVDVKGPIVFRGNYSENHRGPFPRGQMAQFSFCDGTEAQIRVERNFAYIDPDSPDQNDREDAGLGAEDHINGFCCSGSAKFPILIADNYIYGYSSSACGSGIMLGDGGGGHYTVRGNKVYNAGNAGIGAGSGHHWLIEGNRVYQNPAASQYNGKGLQIDNYGEPFGKPITVRDNRVYWLSGKGDASILCAAPEMVEFSGNTFGDLEAFGPVDPMPAREPPEPVEGLLRPWE